ncbi:leucine zipper putative tumor suppressor 1-like [Myxocyprinus asiaticus]|uniref:leucine zipper putative tumor suppressor 1-like n=1 Tax=Myxocyprinus asiaticus TaxID=70543 RepID=UPI0022237D40|nr:leucine zipper putative tumor suppressor 1-like [Myxocyprinus asiaticus]
MQHLQELCMESLGQNSSEINQNILICQLQESQQQTEKYKLSLEAQATEKDEFQRKLRDIQESHDVKMKKNNRKHEENLSQILQQHEMEINALKETITSVEEKAAQYLSDLNNLKSQRTDLNSALKELQMKLEYCEKEKLTQCEPPKFYSVGNLQLLSKVKQKVPDTFFTLFEQVAVSKVWPEKE